jgi:hypothetical protein
MTITVANTTLTNTFEFLVNRTTELADAMTTKVVTTDSNTTPGNATITGTFSANVYIVGNSASNTSISAPNTEQKSSGSYFLNANGSWTSIVANNGIIANTSGIFVNANTGIVVNAAGVFVNSNYIGTLTGVTTSNNALHLGGVLAASYVQNTDSRTLSGNLAFSGANVNFTSSRVGVGNAEIRYVNSPNAMIFAPDGNTEKMRIDYAGSLLVGNTTSRGSRFEVERTDNDNAIADFKTNAPAGDVTIRSSGGVIRVRAQGTNDMALLTSTTVRMLIAANSNVGIANTTPAQTLTVDGTIGGTVVATQAQAETGTDNTLVMSPLRTKQAITQNIATKANLASPTFTGTVSIPTLSLNGTAITATAAELNILDGVTATTAELNKLDGLTATTAELNILDGVTATASELNKLDGVTTTAAEFNFVDGVTSGIQAQLNAKAPLASPTFTGTVAIPTLSLNGTTITASAAELNKLNGVTATTAELNILDGVTATAAELNFVDGVTSAIQAQINTKAPIASPTFTGNISTPSLILNGTTVTASAAELNIMDGITASTAELNFVDGVTSAIQTQLGTKAPLASPSFTGTVAISSLNLGGTTVTDIATQAQAEAGTVNTVVMTPLRTIEAMAGRDFGAVGSYALLGAPPGGGTGVGAFTAGTVYSGRNFGRATLFDEEGNDYMGMTVGSSMSGSWRLMGGSTSGSRDRILGIFLRTS